MPITHAERRKRREKAAEYAKKHGMAKAARKYGLTMSTVRSACVEQGVKPPSEPRVSQRMLNVLVLLNEGKNLSETAAKAGVSKQYVHQVRKSALAAGISLPDLRNTQAGKKGE